MQDGASAVDPDELNKLRLDYCYVQRQPCPEFFCPILCEHGFGPQGLMNGHILNQALKEAFKGDTVIQRKDVDGHFGHTIEPDFIDCLNVGSYSDAEYFKKARKTSVARGQSGKAYPVCVPNRKSNPRQPRINLRDSTGSVYATPIIKGPQREFQNLTEIVVDGTLEFLESAVVGSAIKAAYLTLFRLVGFRITFNWAGDYIRRPLCQFVKDRATKLDAARYFHPFQGCLNFVQNEALDEVDDSLVGNNFLWHSVKDTGLLFAMSCIFHVNDHTLLVTIPAFQDEKDWITALLKYNDHIARRNVDQVVLFTRFEDPTWKVSPVPLPMSYEPRRKPA